MNKKYLTVILVVILPFTIFSQSKNTGIKDTLKYSIDSCVRSFNIDKAQKVAAGYQYWFVDQYFNNGNTVKMSVVEPGLQMHPPKPNPVDEFIFVLEGEGEFYLNGETRHVAAFTCLFYPANVPVGIKNTGKTELKYLVIKPGCNEK